MPIGDVSRLQPPRRVYSSSDNCVFLLGAGFSAPCDLPVMREFMRVVRQRYLPGQLHRHWLEEHYWALLDFFAECRKTTWAFKRDWNNVEELFTQADFRRLARVLSDTGQQLCDSIAWVIWDTYRRARNEPFLPNMRSICDQAIRAGLRPIIVTTNYDTVCEYSLSTRTRRLGNGTIQPFYAYPGFRSHLGDRAPDAGQPPLGTCVLEDPGVGLSKITPPQVPLIKIHGSINWFRSVSGGASRWFASHKIGDSPGRIEDDDFQLEHFLTSVSATPDGAALVEDNAQALQRKSIEPGIIAPALSKDVSAPAIAAQLSAALEALRHAREVWVIGYSFPPTDVFMTRLLTEGLRDNIDFSRLFILDRRPQSLWRSFLDSTLGTTLKESHFRFFQVDTERAIPALYNEHANWETFVERASRDYVQHVHYASRNLSSDENFRET